MFGVDTIIHWLNLAFHPEQYFEVTMKFRDKDEDDSHDQFRSRDHRVKDPIDMLISRRDAIYNEIDRLNIEVDHINDDIQSMSKTTSQCLGVQTRGDILSSIGNDYC
jgi:hypothetical protein